jgi:hypothetical protein
MNGFKPTGYGPSAGFKFPASYGFTGSTGAYTNVQPHVRHKPRAFKDGGYVNKIVGDPGHATVQRDRPYTNEDQQSGGKTPLRRGFKKGGKLHKADGGAVQDLRRKTKMLAADRDFYRASGKQKKADSFQQMLNEQKGSPALDESWRHKSHGRRPGPTSGPLSAMMKGKFAAADGGRVYGSSTKGFGSDIRKTGEFIGQIPRMVTDAMRGAMKRTQDDVATTKRRRIDSIADGTNTASRFAKGGKAKRMGYAKGGAVSRGEAKKIAERTVGEHVKYPAPKGHKGLGAMCK